MLDIRAVVSTTRSGDDVIVRLAPATELDLATAPLLASVLSDVAGGSCERVVVDLAGVAFIDSTGLRVLLLGQSALEADGIKLVLRGPRPRRCGCSTSLECSTWCGSKPPESIRLSARATADRPVWVIRVGSWAPLQCAFRAT